jgi:hypothetical protein
MEQFRGQSTGFHHGRAMITRPGVRAKGTVPGQAAGRSAPVLSLRTGEGAILAGMSEFPFNMFGGDPEELQRAMASFMEQAQQGQRVAFADQAINLAVGMTVAAIGRLDLNGTADEQANQVRDAIRLIFPESVTLVREARQGLS